MQSARFTAAIGNNPT